MTSVIILAFLSQFIGKYLIQPYDLHVSATDSSSEMYNSTCNNEISSLAIERRHPDVQ